jgi:hypothetical protein
LKEPISGAIWPRAPALYTQPCCSEHRFDPPRIARWAVAGDEPTGAATR